MLMYLKNKQTDILKKKQYKNPLKHQYFIDFAVPIIDFIFPYENSNNSKCNDRNFFDSFG